MSSTRSRAKPSSAGSSVVDVNMVASTVAETPMPMPPTDPTPTRSKPSIEIITVVPAKITARPADSMAITVDARAERPA